MSDRELKVIDLPSGKKAKIVTYFTRGETNNIRELAWGESVAEQGDDGEVKIKNIPVNQGMLEQNAVVLNGTKYIDDKEIIGMKDIFEIRDDDFEFIFTELNKLRAKKKI